MGIILMGHFSSESATVRRYGHFCVAVGAVGAVGLLSELSERRMRHDSDRTWSLSGITVGLSELLSVCCRTTVGLSGSVGLLSEVTVGLSDRGSNAAVH